MKRKKSCLFMLMITLFLLIPLFLLRSKIKEIYQILLLQRRTKQVLQEMWGSFFTRGMVLTNNYLYAGKAMKLAVFRISPVHQLELIREFSVAGTIHYLVPFKKNYLGAAAGNAGFLIFDIAHRSKPLLLAQWQSKSSYVRQVQIRNHQAYLALEKKGLAILDLSSIVSPQLLAELYPGSVNFVKLYKNYALLSIAQKGIAILNISNPKKPFLISELPFVKKNLARPMDPPPYDIAIYKNHAYIASGYQGLAIVKLTPPEKPQLLHFFPTKGFCHNITLIHNYAFLTLQPHTILALDLTQPENPQAVKEFSGLGGYPPYAFTKKQGIFLRTRTGFSLVSFTTPLSPKVLSSYAEPASGRGIEIFKGKLYLAAGSQGLKIFNLKNPTQPKLEGHLKVTAFTSKVVLSPPYAFLVDGLGGILIVEIRHPEKPKLLTSYSFDQHPWDLVFSQGHSYLASGSMGLTIFKHSSLTSPRFLSTTPLSHDFIIALTLHQNRAFLSGLINGIYIFDLKKPEKPKLLARIQAHAYDLEVKENLLFLADITGSLQIFRWQPSLKKIASLPVRGIPQNMRIKNKKLYLTVYSPPLFRSKKERGSLLVINISRPSTPILEKKYHLAAHPFDLALHKKIIYIAAGRRELALIDTSQNKTFYFK